MPAKCWIYEEFPGAKIFEQRFFTEESVAILKGV